MGTRKFTYGFLSIFAMVALSFLGAGVAAADDTPWDPNRAPVATQP